MKQKPLKNLGASVKERLLNIARQQRVDFNRLLLLYFQERFLYRLAQSRYKNSFILKGGILLYSAHQMKARPTKDIDLLAKNIKNQPDLFVQIIRDLITMPVDDSVYFEPSSLSFEVIAQKAEYEGVRCKIMAYLDSARQNLQLDIGFGDVVFPHPVVLAYPVLLASDKIELSAYSWDSVSAEKFEAIVKLSDLNSRMKDFYDIHFLSKHHDFIGKELQGALKITFRNRQTNLAEAEHIFSDQFYRHPDKQKQWTAFLRTLRQTATPFAETVLSIKTFVTPLIQSIMTASDFDYKWNSRDCFWIAAG